MLLTICAFVRPSFFIFSLSSLTSISASTRLIENSNAISPSLVSFIPSANSFTFFPFEYGGLRYISKVGVVGSFLPSRISIILGKPSVTFISATPAKWNVFNVICVPGSPIDSADIMPTASPGVTLTSSYSCTVLSNIFFSFA